MIIDSHIHIGKIIKFNMPDLDEWLDFVPTNKIIGFDGDLITLPEHVWGMLAMAKENLARALARRIGRDRLDLDGAKEILQLWMCENPARVYKLPQHGYRLGVPA